MGADDAANNAKLLRALAGVPQEQRRARYRCALVFVESAADAAPLIAEADWQGFILDAPRGGGGFGYDPYFWLPELKDRGRTAPAEKNRLSHRGKALRALRDQLAATTCDRYPRWRCMCICRGACANARTAISIRIS